MLSTEPPYPKGLNPHAPKLIDILSGNDAMTFHNVTCQVYPLLFLRFPF